MQAEIIAVGTELLLGDVLDTNSQYLSKELASLGLSLRHRQTVGDNPDRLKAAIELALSRAEVVVLCGGLGPTPDDLTKETACDVMGMVPVLHEASLARMQAYFDRSGRVMSENNRKQALFPKEAVVFDNDHGTAPGGALSKNGKHILLLPGPPRELIPMFESAAKAYLRPFCDGVMYSRIVRVFGMGESVAAQKAATFLQQQNPTVAPYAKAGEMYFRVTAKADTEEQAKALCTPTVQALCALLGDVVYGVDVDSLEQAVVNELTARGQTVATAESCTGGLISERLTAVAGASAVFSCGVTAYSADIKHRVLGVRQDTIDAVGTVASQTAKEMAEGIRALAKADFGVAVTGSAGPSPCEGKAVGTVFVALADKHGTEVRELNLTHRPDRDYIRTVTASHALHMVLAASRKQENGEQTSQ